MNDLLIYSVGTEYRVEKVVLKKGSLAKYAVRLHGLILYSVCLPEMNREASSH